MLDAHDKVAVLNWSERQLGDAARRAAIFELSGESEFELVEKSGTGIQRFSCEPFLSVMADSIQTLSVAAKEAVSYQNINLGPKLRIRKSEIH